MSRSKWTDCGTSVDKQKEKEEQGAGRGGRERKIFGHVECVDDDE